MASVTITIDDAIIPRIQAAFQVSTAAEFKDKLEQHIKQYTLAYEDAQELKTEKAAREAKLQADREAWLAAKRAELGL